MNSMQPIIFLFPIIALVSSIILYFILLNISPDKKRLNGLIFNLCILAFVFNLVWELIQIPFYAKASYSLYHIAFCALASVADVIMVFELYLICSLIFKNAFWVKKILWQKSLLVIIIGASGAILSEKFHLVWGSWAYSPSMPIIPFVNVGLTPTLQFMILPLVIYHLSYHQVLF